MLAGRTTFYLVAGLAGAVCGEAIASAAVHGAATLIGGTEASHHPCLAGEPAVFTILAAGVAGGVWAGVAVLRWWYRRQAERASPAA